MSWVRERAGMEAQKSILFAIDEEPAAAAPAPKASAAEGAPAPEAAVVPGSPTSVRSAEKASKNDAADRAEAAAFEKRYLELWEPCGDGDEGGGKEEEEECLEAMIAQESEPSPMSKKYSLVGDLPPLEEARPKKEAAAVEAPGRDLAQEREEMLQQRLQEQLQLQQAAMQVKMDRQLQEHMEQQQEHLRQQFELQKLQQEQLLEQQREQLRHQEEQQKLAQELLENEKKKNDEQQRQLQEQQEQLQKQKADFEAEQAKPKEVPYRTLPPKSKSKEAKDGVPKSPKKEEDVPKSPTKEEEAAPAPAKDKLPSLDLSGGRGSPPVQSSGGGSAPSNSTAAANLQLPPLAAPLGPTPLTPGGGPRRSRLRSSSKRHSASTPALTGIVRTEQDEINDLRAQLQQEMVDHESTTGKVKDLERQLRILQAKQRKHSPPPRPPKKFGIASAAPYAKEQPLPPKVPTPKNNKAFFLPSLRSLPQAPPKETRQRAEAEAAAVRTASMAASGAPQLSRQSKSQARIEAITKLDQMGMNTWHVRRAEKVARLQDLQSFSSGMWDSFFDWRHEDSLAQ
mmetsp:Transcript_55971/g.142376  ORF Transcript_55971/g.142376 Transcript_55971/m.142376 type:complete len:567 (-) Transcript_55971:121-1821(-)